MNIQYDWYTLTGGLAQSSAQQWVAGMRFINGLYGRKNQSPKANENGVREG